MKNIMIFFLLIIFLFSQEKKTNLFASINLGVPSGEDFNGTDGRVSFEVGAGFDLFLPKSSGLSLNIYYEQRKVGSGSQSLDVSQTFGFLSVRPSFKTASNRYLEIGPVVSVLINESVSVTDGSNSISGDTSTGNEIMFGVYGGVGFRTEKILISFGFNVALTNIYKESESGGKLHSMKFGLGILL